MTIGLLDYRTM